VVSGELHAPGKESLVGPRTALDDVERAIK
jgi:hypothetical protein